MGAEPHEGIWIAGEVDEVSCSETGCEEEGLLWRMGEGVREGRRYSGVESSGGRDKTEVRVGGEGGSCVEIREAGWGRHGDGREGECIDEFFAAEIELLIRYALLTAALCGVSQRLVSDIDRTGICDRGG